MAELTRQLRESRWMPLLVLLLILAVFGGAIALGAGRLRRSLHSQLINRDGDILHAVALAQQFAPGKRARLGARLQNPADQLALALSISQLKDDVLAVRLYDADGRFVTAFPPSVTEAGLSPEVLGDLRALRPVCQFLAAGDMAQFQILEDAASAEPGQEPLLDVFIPIHERKGGAMLGAAQLVLNARSLADELERLDAALGRQAVLMFLVGGGLLTLVLLWAYRRLERSRALLRQRTEHLLHANHELALAAKTGALGAVTAHLVHGLSNPLANLQAIIASRGGAQPGDADWQDAVAATRRMQSLVHEIVRVLGEESGGDLYEMTLEEMARILAAKVQPRAHEAGVRLEWNASAAGRLANRHANLVLLILENLLHNAIQVTPSGRRVRVVVASSGGEVVCRIEDEGPGFPPHLVPQVFTPCRSTHGGCGLGLAISRQLAVHLGARLELVATTSAGCVFALTLPASILTGAPPAPAALAAS